MRPVRDERCVISIDIDKDRLRHIVGVAYDFTTEYLYVPLHRTREETLATLEAIITSNRVSTNFFLDFSSARMDDFQLRVDPRRREVLGITARFTKLKNNINAFLRTL